MRTIKKRDPPSSLVNWRQTRIAANDPIAMPFQYRDLRASGIIGHVEQSLFEEQGGICAYTGIALSVNKDGGPRFHIEHLVPQIHCSPGQDTDYTNLVACWPAPNQPGKILYGAILKDEWPSPTEVRDFISPIRPDCTKRFAFKQNGEVLPAVPNDVAAETTIKKLGLDHPELTAKRKQAILGALNPTKSLKVDLNVARKLQGQLESLERRLDMGHSVRLPAFHFALKPAVEREVRKLEMIAKNLKHRKS